MTKGHEAERVIKRMKRVKKTGSAVMDATAHVEHELEANRSKFRKLLKECVVTYIPTQPGKRHREIYVSSRQQARQNWALVQAAEQGGEDITDLVLNKLLPHWDDSAAQNNNLWINAGASAFRDLKSHYQGLGWQKAENWPYVAKAIFQFIEECVNNPAQLDQAIQVFEQSGYSKGFASGMLTPILNALRPDDFVMINRKSLEALRLFTGKVYKSQLSGYPAANAAAQMLLAKYRDVFPEVQQSELHPSDLFDMLAHWLTLPGNARKAVAIDADIDAEPLDLLLTPDPGAAFSAETFTLLKQLHAKPRYGFYEEHQAEFEQHLINPFQHLLKAVANHLPPSLLDVLETEKNLFSKIRKNDYGVGGAYDFYWGAFYPKGGRRTVSAQLFIHLDKDHLDFGFYGEGCSQVFESRCAKNLKGLERQLATSLDYAPLRFGSREIVHANRTPKLTWKQWLRNPVSNGVRAGVFITRDEVLQIPFEDLVAQITGIFQRLFPLVLLTIASNPLTAIANYIERDETEESDGDTSPGYSIEPSYSMAQMAVDTLLSEESLESYKRAIERKGQIIFYGPPGTGKTFLARHLARHLVGGGNGFWELMQFHPAYAYEDFIEGIRPRSVQSPLIENAQGSPRQGAVQNGAGFTYEMVPGRFLDFCDRAKKRDGLCVLIIDEINRAELSRVFGELMYLLEYRSIDGADNGDDFPAIPLAGGTKFSIPPNVRIIGTMNTADRSIALVDHALRRRFAFIGVHPDYDLLRRYQARHAPEFPVDALVEWLRKVNNAIDDPHYALGVSFFLRKDLAVHIQDIWRMEIEPYLEEYFFDRRGKAGEFSWSKSPLSSLISDQTKARKGDSSDE